MEFSAVFAFLLLVIVAAKGVQKITDMIRNGFDRAGRAPKWVWNAVAFAVPAFGVYLGDIDPDAFGVPGPDAVIKVVIVIAVGGFAAFWHETDDLVSAKAEAVRTEASR